MNAFEMDLFRVCQACQLHGQTSKVFSEGGTCTAMYCRPYWDEEGRPHHHDSNKRTRFFRCSKGHQWTEVADKPKCPTCGSNW